MFKKNNAELNVLIEPCDGKFTEYSFGVVPEIVITAVSKDGSTSGYGLYSNLKRTSISVPSVAAVNVIFPPFGNSKG